MNGRVRGVGGREVGVDPLQVDVQIVQHGASLRAGGEQRVGLLGDLVLGLLRGLECLERADQVDRADPGSIDRGQQAVVTRLLQQQVRSSASTHPAPQVTSSRVIPNTCGTSYWSRRTVTPGWGTCSSVYGPRGGIAERHRLEELRQLALADVVEHRRQRVVHVRLRLGGGRCRERVRNCPPARCRARCSRSPSATLERPGTKRRRPPGSRPSPGPISTATATAAASDVTSQHGLLLLVWDSHPTRPGASRCGRGWRGPAGDGGAPLLAGL